MYVHLFINVFLKINLKKIDSIKVSSFCRYCSKPFEYIVQCTPYKRDELCFLLQEILLTRKAFLTDHRYDPFEIYSTDEFLEELEDIPDPKREPLEFLDIMLQVLLEMGPWCADRIAFNVYQRIEKQKIKTPHERHYILLCLVNTALLEVHAICEQHFRKYKNNYKACVENYSSPKVLRLLEILRLFKPDDNTSKNDTMKRISSELDAMDFQKLSLILETKCHSVEQAVEKQQLESRSIVENLDSVIKPEFHNKIAKEKINIENDEENKGRNCKSKTEAGSQQPSVITNQRTSSGQNNNRTKRRPFRRHRVQYDASDTLCSIIFCNSNYTARVLFELLAEMSRQDPCLKFIKCQFTTDRVADPITEPKEAESEHRRQEEVLKRFRMHDCNILIGTSILEEGIDVPKCNLVIRWDPPTTYRSYVQCKGKARAVPAYHVLLVAPEWTYFLNRAACNEQLNDESHRLICHLDDEDCSCLSDADNSDRAENVNDDEDESKEINGVSMKQKFMYGSSKGTIKILNPEVITYKHPSKTATANAASPNLILKEIKDDSLAIEHIKENATSIQNNDAISNKPLINEVNKLTLNNSIRVNQNINNSSQLETYNSQNHIDIGDINDSNINIATNKSEPHDVSTISEESSNVKASSKDNEYTVLNIDDILNNFDAMNGGKKEETYSPPKQKIQKKFRCLLDDNNKIGPQNDKSVIEMQQLENMENTTNKIVQQMAEYREIEKVINFTNMRTDCKR